MGAFLYTSAVIGQPNVTAGKITVNQANTTLAAGAIEITQADTNESFLDLVGTSGTLGTQSISTTATGTAAGHFAIDINGTQQWVRYYGTPA